MYKITADDILSKYKPGKVANSFYREQRLHSRTSRVHMGEGQQSEMVYYADSGSQTLRVKPYFISR